MAASSERRGASISGKEGMTYRCGRLVRMLRGCVVFMF